MGPQVIPLMAAPPPAAALLSGPPNFEVLNTGMFCRVLLIIAVLLKTNIGYT